MLLFPTQTFEVDVAAAIGNDSASLVAFGSCSARLFQTDIPADPNQPLSTYDSASATFNGYVQKAVTWSPATIGADGLVELLGTVSAWRPTGSDTPNSIYGLYLVDGHDSLAAVGRFDDPPVAMENALNKIEVVLRFQPTINLPVVVVP